MQLLKQLIFTPFWINSLILIALFNTSILTTNRASAQIIPDQTLPQNSDVTNFGKTQIINQGTRVERNLFHSFERFSVPTNTSAHFNNDFDIENIITRVTGSSFSHIDGLIRANGTANLFLVNPQGIIFGNNARLDIGGSFVASTADSLQFANGSEFLTNSPTGFSAPLLTINTPIGLQLGKTTTNPIVNQGDLTVKPGNNINLTASAVINTGKLQAPGGEISLVSVPSLAQVQLGNNGQVNGVRVINPQPATEITSLPQFLLQLSNSNLTASIPKTTGTTITTGEIDASGATGGEIHILGHQVGVYTGAKVNAWGNNGGGRVLIGGNPQGEGLLLNADATFIAPDTRIDASAIAQGNGGEIIVWSDNSTRSYGEFLVRGGSFGGNGGLIETSGRNFLDVTGIRVNGSANAGLAGTWLLDPRNVKLDYAPSSNGDFSRENPNVFVPSGDDAIVNIADIQDQLSAGTNVIITTGTTGEQEGNITTTTTGFGINPTNTTPVTLTLRAANNIILSSQEGGFGINGQNAPFNLVLEADSDRSGGGNIIIGGANGWGIDTKGGELRVNTTGLFSIFNGGINSNNDSNIAAGTINIFANQITLEKAGISANTTGIGKAADINVNASLVQLLGDAGINSNTKGAGGGGNVTINTGNLLIQNRGGIGSDEQESTGTGNLGNVQVTATETIKLVNQAGIGSANRGDGNTGNVTVNAPLIMIDNGSIRSQARGRGNGGDVTVNGDDLLVENNSFIGNESRGGGGNLGRVNVTANNSVTLRNFAGISSNVRGERGNAGVVNLKTSALRIENRSGLGSDVGADTNGNLLEGVNSTGNAGVINIEADSIFITGTSGTGTKTFGSGSSGITSIRTGTLVLRDDSGISAETGVDRKAGAVATNNTGQGGSIEIIAQLIDLEEKSRISSQTGGQGDAGEIRITTDRLILNNQGNITTSTLGGIGGDAGAAGRIKITANSVRLNDAGAIISETLSNGVGGNIELDVKGDLKLSDRARISTSSTGSTQLSRAGNITITANSLELSNNAQILSQSASGDGGNIQIQLPEALTLRSGGQISTTTGSNQTGGNGGNIDIKAKFIIAYPNANSDITANAFAGQGGNINITTQGLFNIRPAKTQTPDNDITASSQLGIQGQVVITQPDETQPSKGIIDLPSYIVDVSDQIGQICPTGINAKPLAEFFVIGKGGLPPNPVELLTGDTFSRELTTWNEQVNTLNHLHQPHSQQPESTIIEAQAWVKTPDGKVMLVANLPQTPVRQISCLR
ncbi:two-partner secretion domain-containing protein [Calothrix sp. NIES-3974]|uniref:two-partner secretion domain-containing protein n=1 Tax=Calothrix sp. NIES-3974 TaxID=2005462 RepID=UPI000B603DA6|nr:filamentous hemagglutinin N-terminal domain-containing protein [Calothrix sp. NIES-3974]BAZ05163.1 hypothetical protein NIES3974_18090 [Calothrix sp. NIES-3974]